MLSPEEMRQIADRVIPGGVQWQSGISGFCTCPGEHLHHNLTGMRDCKVMLGAEAPGKTEAPTIACFHRSCAEVVSTFNYRLRSEIGRAKGAPTGARAGSGSRRTARTANFDLSSNTSTEVRTARTVILKPLRVCARAHTHTHVQGDGNFPSVPSGAISPTAGAVDAQPVAESSDVGPCDVTVIIDGVAMRTHSQGKELPRPRIMGEVS